jgi:hypothetical protein
MSIAGVPISLWQQLSTVADVSFVGAGGQAPIITAKPGLSTTNINPFSGTSQDMFTLSDPIMKPNLQLAPTGTQQDFQNQGFQTQGFQNPKGFTRTLNTGDPQPQYPSTDQTPDQGSGFVPPGLAKKNTGGLPPGIAKKMNGGNQGHKGHGP